MGKRRVVVKEEAVQFGERRSLVGIVTSAAPEKGERPGVILLNPGIVHRVGPGRIYVKIARALAPQGFTVLRCDFSGIGDSSVRRDNLRFEESSVDEACAAMSFLHTTRGVKRFILLGGCSGAAVSLETARADKRVTSTILINFPARVDREDQTANRNDCHYYWNFALLSLRSWRKLLTGQANYRKISQALVEGLKHKFIDRTRASDSDQRFRATLRELAARGVQLTFICSKGDPLLQDLREAGGSDLKQLCVQDKVAVDVIPRSDHTFSSLHDQDRLVDAILERVNQTALNPAQQSRVPATSSSPVGALFQQQSTS